MPVNALLYMPAHSEEEKNRERGIRIKRPKSLIDRMWERKYTTETKRQVIRVQNLVTQGRREEAKKREIRTKDEYWTKRNKN